MGTILEIILQTIGMALFAFPGAFIRWAFTGFKKSYRDVLLDDSEFNAPVGLFASISATLVVVLLTACNNTQHYSAGSDTTKVENKDTSIPEIAEDTLDRALMIMVDSVVNAIKDSEDNTLTAYFPPNEFTDTLKTVLFLKQGRPKRIQYSTFEDSGAAYGNSDFYFDDVFGIIGANQNQNSTFYECATPDGRYLRFRKWEGNGKFDRQKDPFEARDFFYGCMLRAVHDLIQLYPDIKFNIPNISVNGDARLLAMKAMPLYDAPDTTAHKIKMLGYRARIGYIRTNDTVGVYGGRKWIWYLVKSGIDSGWVIGHPDFVQELTDENAEDWPE